ncbi:hypothetical protein [Alkalihalobacillus trypoxylicola]|uniref:Phage portal protein n=1 Tax=Alkalihalobacillus trypoxylicola TaxID=519424 RepID=A0A162EWC0_9BACI|nr:hypothetical protein [Alkalihalobacillus trypoxylicola]KYG33890.1 phage portal protein [Alkalihalobacillus trypoxylicola]
MIEIWNIKTNEHLELVTSEVVWEGQRFSAARKISVEIVIRQGTQTYHSVEEGDTVLFKWRGKELFRGTVFSRVPDESTVSFIAYDMLRYLTGNQDVYVFSNQRADQITRRICNDFQIPMTTISHTGFVIKSLLFKNDTNLYDIILKALSETRSQTGNIYQLYSSKGKLGLRAWPNPSEIWVLETGDKESANITSYDYSTSIDEDTATKVKLRMQKEDKTYTAVANDSAGRNKYGILQYTETVTEDLNQAQLQQRANVRQSQRRGVKRKLSSIQAIGIDEVQSGLPVRVIIPEISVNQNYWVDKDIHTFRGNTHTMVLNVIRTNAIPEGSA